MEPKSVCSPYPLPYLMLAAIHAIDIRQMPYGMGSVDKWRLILKS